MGRDSAWVAASITRALGIASVAGPCLLAGGPLQAAPALPPALASAVDPALLCRAAIAMTERNTRIPDEFLSAMGRVESGRPDDGALAPWPWTVNAAGTGHFYASKAEAIAAVRTFLANGVRSLDVGCLQVNLFYHPDAFASLDQAFDPAANAAYAAKLLMELFAQTGSWPRAAAAYHSQTPALGTAYLQKVLEAWATPDRPGAAGDPRARGHAAPPARDAAATLAAPPVREAAQPPAAMPSAFGFSRRFTLPQSRPVAGGGRSLAAYRSVPVRMVLRQPLPVVR
jgi:hypothetical protein